MAVDRARAQVAAWAGRPPKDVTFTSGATEANATVLCGARTSERPLVVTTAVEHPSVLAWADRTIPVDGRGVVELAALAALLDADGPRVAVVSAMAANNETGVLQPVDEIAGLARAAGALMHIDAVQLPGRARCDLSCADAITLSAHKIGGPRGVGALISRVEIPPLLRGGPQERGRRAGTLNTPGIAGMGAAFSRAGVMEAGGRDLLEAACVRLGGEVLGAGAPRLPHTLSVLMPHPGDMLVIALDLEGVAVSTGSACSSGAGTASHVVAAMGRTGVPVRFSLGPGSRVEDAIAALERVMARLGPCAS